ncbi:MAG TPA: XdhC family protein [Chthoniobacterales bacterium]|nr:XdhC family protein [Chthoniobacterales bacterium]
MNDEILEELLRARRKRLPCVLATIASTSGSVPRAAGSKMLVYADGRISGTIGGGKFEALVVADSLAALREKKPALKTYPLHEAAPDSFGAICGGECTVLMEPQVPTPAIFLVGGGHCAHAIARLALDCGMHVTVVDDREEVLSDLPDNVQRVSDVSAPEFIRGRAWAEDEALLLVSRNHQCDREALAAALRTDGIRYIGMIGSRRKVRLVFDALAADGIPKERLARVYAPIGLDIGADSPAEIAVSAIAEILKLQRGGSGEHLRSLKA